MLAQELALTTRADSTRRYRHAHKRLPMRAHVYRAMILAWTGRRRNGILGRAVRSPPTWGFGEKWGKYFIPSFTPGGVRPSKSEARIEAIVVKASDSENQIMAMIPIERDWLTGKAMLGATKKFRDDQIFPADFSTAE